MESISNENLEIRLLPSKWSQRLRPEVIVEKHVEFCDKESERSRRTIPCALSIEYGPLEKEKIDIFGTDLEDGAPVFVFVHGGYWQETSLRRDTYHFLATTLYKHGIRTIFVGYELCPQVELGKIIEEIENATRKCIEYARETRSKGLYIAGYSAGSHLVACLFTQIAAIAAEDRKDLKAAILLAGIYDLTQIPKTSINVPLQLSAQDAEKLSPFRQKLADEISTSFYVISAEHDSPEFRRQSEELHEKLVAHGASSKNIVVRNVDHFDLIENLVKEDFELTKMILNLILRKNAEKK